MFFNMAINISLVLLLLNVSLHANMESKSRAGLHYSYAATRDVAKIIGGETISLEGLHRAGIGVDIPYNKFLLFGFSFDYTLANSPRFGDKRLAKDNEVKKISTTFLGLSALIKPQIPFANPIGDFHLYTSLETGGGASTPITFGTQALSNYNHDENSSGRFPTPFPLYLETSAKLGLEYFFSELVGVDFGFGCRVLWVVHPMVKPENPRNSVSEHPALWYDITSLFGFASLKLAF